MRRSLIKSLLVQWKCIRKLALVILSIFYHRALIIEFKLQKVHFEDEFEIRIYYKGEQVGIRRVDFLVEKEVPVEIKAASELSDLNIAQAQKYLEAGGVEIGLLINFGASSLQFKRMINNRMSHT